jgi:SAM-dependent methyltransferase
MSSVDQKTADSFANSWNNVYDPSVYTEEQFLDWIDPWNKERIEGKSVMELGCGSGALLVHMQHLKPGKLIGLDLGSSVNTAKNLLGDAAQIEQGDLTDSSSILERFGQQDFCYSIGVLHHLTNPKDGYDSLLKCTKPGGHFHGWVYAHEGNAVVRYFVDPIRKIANCLPWFFNKFFIALPLSIPFFLYSKFCSLLAKASSPNLPLPMMSYMLWIGKRNFSFHHHVAFDQLVTPMTHYIPKATVEQWLNDPQVDPDSVYIIFRNANSWKFGGKKKTD